MEPIRASDLALRLERDGDVPLGTQLAWALRARIVRGVLVPGDQLPTLRDLAETVGLNANTVRSVYTRLQREGLIESRHGSGTFVTEEAVAHRGIAEVADAAARAAVAARLHPRDVAAALYSDAQSIDDAPNSSQARGTAAERRKLRQEIAALESALAGLQAAFPDMQVVTNRRRQGGKVLSLIELGEVRDELIARLTALGRQVRTPDRIERGEHAPAQDSRSGRRTVTRPRLANS